VKRGAKRFIAYKIPRAHVSIRLPAHANSRAAPDRVLFQPDADASGQVGAAANRQRSAEG